MNKISVFLIVITVVSAICGVYAFKSQNSGGHFYCSTTAGGDCASVRYTPSETGIRNKYCRPIEDPGTCPSHDPIEADQDNLVSISDA